MQALLDSLRPGEEDWVLAQQIDAARLPAHIAVIMDGNGRWARQRNLPRVAGHKAGVDPVRMVVETCAQLGLSAVTLYAFSVENWKRPVSEVDMLWRLLKLYLRRELANLQRNNIRLQAIGRLHQLPDTVRAELDHATASTAGNTGLQLNLAINYGGRAEIVDAVNTLVEEARREGRLDSFQLDEQALASRLYTRSLPDPDLLIRTSGEMRVSNFLLWQIAYAELHVIDTLWPDFQRNHLLEAVLEYQKRDRRFGGLAPAATPAPAEVSWLEALGVSAR